MNSTLSLSQVFGAVNRHRGTSAMVFFLIMVLVLTAFVMWPRRFGSEGRLFVQLGRNNTGMDPSVGAQSVSIQDSRETEIRSVVELIKSRAVIETAVDEIGADQILSNPMQRWLPKLGGWSLGRGSTNDDGSGLSAEEVDRLIQREQAAEELENSLRVHAEQNTSVISIHCRAYSPILAQRLVETLMRLTKEKHLDVHSVKGTTKFFDQEFQRQESELNEAIARQKAFRDEHGFLSADGARNSLQQVINKIENDLVDARANVAQATEHYRNIRQELEGVDQQIIVPRSGVERLSFEDSTTELFTLKREFERVRSTFTEDHPRIAIISAQIEKLERELKRMSTDRVENEQRLNPVYEELKVELVKAGAAAQAAKAKLNDLEIRLEASEHRMSELNTAKSEADQRQRDVDIARQYLDIFIQKRGEASVLEQLDKQRISDVVVAQPANLVLKKESPQGSFVLPLGLLLAICGALGAALFADRGMLNASGDESIESTLGLPVLATLPRVRRERSMIS